MLKVRSWAARTVAWVGVEDTVRGSVEVRSIAWVAHVGSSDLDLKIRTKTNKKRPIPRNPEQNLTSSAASHQIRVKPHEK